MQKRTLNRLSMICLFGFALIVTAGCQQAEGEPCQTDSDCQGGLVCCFDITNGKGTCQESCVAPDAGPDAAEPDGAEPDGAEPDGADTDAADIDAADIDAAMIDAADIDAADIDAAIIDATVDASP
jgi:hypothetical protein